MPNIPVTIIAASRPIPARSMREDGRSADAGMNLEVSRISTIPIGTLTRKMPRQVQ